MSEIIDPGELKERITIESATDSQDAFGEPVSTWGTHATVWAKVEFRDTFSAGEEILADKKTNVVPVHFTVRLSDSIDAKMRIVYRATTYEILNIMEIQNRTFQVIETQAYE